MKKEKIKMSKMIAHVAKATAKMEANTSCAFLGYQSKEPKRVKNLRKF